MSPTALTWAFASSVVSLLATWLTSANSHHGSWSWSRISVQKTLPSSGFSQVRAEISTQSYSNFGLTEFELTSSVTTTKGVIIAQYTRR